jgi:MYXO-CTERM domain-containing protein
LYAAQGAGQPAGSLQLVGLATNIALPGYFSGGSPFVMPAPYAAGDTITFQIKGWTLSAGNTYAEAVTAQAGNPTGVALGQSGLGQTILTANPAPPAPLFGTSPGLLSTGFGIVPAPEPSSIALGLLGLGAIALFRRRK